MREEPIKVRFYKGGRWTYEDLEWSAFLALRDDLNRIYDEQKPIQHEVEAERLKVLLD